MIPHEKRNELERYADLEESVIGDACTLLLQLCSYTDYISDEFSVALEKEIDEQLDCFKGNTVIEDREETITRKFKELVWI